MGTLLKVDEWKSGLQRWYVADVHTWTNWRACAEVLDVELTVEAFTDYLRTKYNAVVDHYLEEKDFLMFYWTLDNYKNAHQFKLDVNRIARKKDYQV
jgi:hypothetical protein